MGIPHHRTLDFVGSSNLSQKISEFWYPIIRITWHWLNSYELCLIPMTNPMTFSAGFRLTQIPTKLIEI
jgi:hypothetical protein